MRIRSLAVGLAVAPWMHASAQRGTDSIPPPRIVDAALQLFNAPATRRVNGPYTIEASREVTGDVAALGGALTVEGHVTGRIVAINADVHLVRGARVGKDVLVIGGRLDGVDSATVADGVRVYSAALSVARDGERLVRRAAGSEPGDLSGPWWRRHERWRSRAWGSLRLLSARTYNRVEGLPIYVGPTFGRNLAWGRLTVDGYGIIRSADSFNWKEENLGHSVTTEVSLGQERGVRFGGRLFDVVEAVEPWQLPDQEVGLATFFLHRDFRDYFNRHGARLSASWFRGRDLDATLSYGEERWASRRTRDPWTLFRNNEGWRPNPAMDEGLFHLANLTVRYDTRNSDNNPWSGWYLMADYEYGTGTTTRYAPATPQAHRETLDGATSYDRLFLDLRRYNRIAPDQQVNLRLVLGGWLSGDDLPLERRFSLGGPGTMPGYDFRRATGRTDYLQCSTPTLVDAPPVAGRPAQCERFALAQVELRGDLNFDLFGVLNEDRRTRRLGWGRGTQWVVFADVGRGWLVGEREGTLSYGSWTIPSLGTFRTDVGLGLVLDDVGIYAAKSLSNGSRPINIFVRLRPRF